MSKNTYIYVKSFKFIPIIYYIPNYFLYDSYIFIYDYDDYDYVIDSWDLNRICYIYGWDIGYWQHWLPMNNNEVFLILNETVVNKLIKMFYKIIQLFSLYTKVN